MAAECLPRSRKLTSKAECFRGFYARNAGIRIDHFALNASTAKMLSAGGIDREVRGWEKTSEHAPVWIELAKRRANRQTNTRG